MHALGLMNCDQVLRHSRLDFKDLYQSGLDFDRFKGEIELGQGFAHTLEPITRDGPSARMKFSGRSDLRAQTIDADLIVTLPIGSNLPWVAALAGGLPESAAAMRTEKIPPMKTVQGMPITQAAKPPRKARRAFGRPTQRTISPEVSVFTASAIAAGPS